jgi:hypothetical protein
MFMHHHFVSAALQQQQKVYNNCRTPPRTPNREGKKIEIKQLQPIRQNKNVFFKALQTKVNP